VVLLAGKSADLPTDEMQGTSSDLPAGEKKRRPVTMKIACQSFAIWRTLM